MRKYIIILLYCFALSQVAMPQSTVEYAADFPEILPQSPQAAAFTRYGEYPVSKATGVPQIDIPLYTINNKDINIPISISYHASGIKVEDVATPVGLGWSLNTGGVITRSIYGSVDKQNYSNNYVKSSDHVVQLMQNKNADVNQTWKRWGRVYNEDTQSDRYVYNFNGKTGVFRYNSLNNQITTIPYAPLVIEATATGFKIKDTDGLIYHFGCLETQSLDNVLHTSAWYITKIESQQTGATITYTYTQGSSYIEYSMSEIERKGTKYWREATFGSDIKSDEQYETERNLARMVYIPQLLREISWENNKIEFEYTSDRSDKYKDRLNSIEISEGRNIIKNITFNNSSYWGNNDKNYRMRLNSVEIKGEGSSILNEKYQFVYNTTNLPDYNRSEIISDQFYCREDYWGYYNGSSTLNRFIPREYSLYGDGANRNPDASFMQACILKEIIYPTGGSTTFEFESNRASGAYDYNYNEAFIGGLRVKSIVSKTNAGEIRKTYEYSGVLNQTISKDMFQYKQDRIYSFQPENSGFIIRASEWEISTSSPLYSITGWSSSPVFYTAVTEYIGNKEQNTGKTISKFKKNIRDEYAFPDYPNDIYDQNINRFWSPYYNYDQGLLEPLLTSEEVYEYANNTYTLKKEIRNEYISVDKGQILFGVRISFRDDWVPDGGTPANSYFPYYTIDEFFTENVVYYDLIAYRYFNLLNKTQTIEYNPSGNINTTVSYAYDSNHRLLSPIKTTTVNSNGISIIESTTHPFNMTVAPYTEMVTNNVISPVIQKTRSTANSSISIKNTYKKENSKFLLDNVSTGIGTNLETRLTYHNYDTYGNPIYISKDDATKIVYLWGYSGQYPIAEIQNATYDQVKTALGVTPESLSSATTPDFTKLEALRSNSTLSNALITTYTYKPLVGMTSMTDPRGVTTYYEYDSFGRLYRTLDANKKVIQTYDYHYQNQ